MTDYTPDEATVKADWSEFLYLTSYGMKHVDDSGEEFDRFIAKTKANALREAAWADEMPDTPAHWLIARADQIEDTTP